MCIRDRYLEGRANAVEINYRPHLAQMCLTPSDGSTQLEVKVSSPLRISKRRASTIQENYSPILHKFSIIHSYHFGLQIHNGGKILIHEEPAFRRLERKTNKIWSMKRVQYRFQSFGAGNKRVGMVGGLQSARWSHIPCLSNTERSLIQLETNKTRFGKSLE